MKIRCSIRLILFGSAFLLWPDDARPQGNPIDTIRSARRVCLLVNEVYARADSVHLPFAELTRTLLDYAGVTIAGGGDNCDIGLTITARGEALAASYFGKGTQFSGATLSGEMVFARLGNVVLRRPFSGTEQPPKSIFVDYPSPSRAPFRYLLYKPSSFVPVLFRVFSEIYGDQIALKALQAGDAEIVRLAAIALAAAGDPRGAKAIAARLGEGVGGDVFSFVSGLAEIGDAAVDPLIQVLKSQNPLARQNAAQALGLIKSPRSYDALLAALRDADPSVQYQAARALGSLGDKRAVDALVTCVKNPLRDDVRRGAADALGELKDIRAVEPLIQVLAKSSDINSSVAFALAKITGRSSSDGISTRYGDWSEWWKQNRDKYLKK